jgi:hypothetical protein
MTLERLISEFRVINYFERNLPAPLKPIFVPAVVSLALFVLAIAVLAVPYGWFYLVIVVFAYPAVSSVAFVIGAGSLVVWFWRRDRSSGLAMAIGIIIVGVSAVPPYSEYSPAMKIVDLVQVAAYRGDLQRQVREMKAQGVSPTIAEIELGGIGSITFGIAFDPTGEILLPPKKRSASWTATGGQTELGVDGMEARHIIGSYYAWSLP